MALAVPWAAVVPALHEARSLAGKVVWDCTNALKPDMSGLALGTSTSGGETVQGLVPGARVVKGIPPFAELLHSADPTALRDCGIRALAIVGIALEIGIEPTARHAADLGFIPVVVTEACGFGNEEAARRSINALEFAGDTIFTDTNTFHQLLQPR